ncbi:biotin--[acetyl-CoA-carboxylase] ligase [Aerolutibacter ruishenii]|uniref:Bifunctional ligase/repressor BirA n=1 Tax=Aerolutibacter ruishenii TaxID=686800 RepID=A0A562M336_9GAMM|nr:biotin--[acetyl-CoA-carboxylase] ligase [Lysobacter ruishenii]TWI14339.1 BirA family biotin operon repressor/biotin-[acetyl-CoA-carboxylase] ligase [Lysobacter ruishenii]
MDDRLLLATLIAGPATGDALARHAGLTRAAVWKRIQWLREAGVPIEASPGRGYRLAVPMQLLATDAIEERLAPATRARLVALDVAWSVDSTNTRLLARGVPGDGLALALLAECQAAGRGRRGRRWTSPLGANVYLSVARGFTGGLGRLGGLSLVAGIAAAEALHALGATAVRLKWPNDLVVVSDGGLRKLGGLLVEGGGEHAGPAHAVVGLGINVRMPAAHAAMIDQPWCDLAELSGTVDRNVVAAAVLDRLVPALDQFDAAGLAPFLPRYAALDALVGQHVTLVAADGGTREAIAEGLADDGALRVRLPDGAQACVHSGEVSVRREAAP